MHVNAPSLNILRLGIIGATGSMGQRVLRLVKGHQDLAVSALWVRDPHSTSLARQVEHLPGSVLVTQDLTAFCAASDVVIDFSAPAQVRRVAPALAEREGRVAYIVASTGLDAEDEAALVAASAKLAILRAANLSLGVSVLVELVKSAAEKLVAQHGWDAEIVEMHHRRKTDGPSGTALALGAAISVKAPQRVPHVGRSHQPPAGRPDNELGYSVVRGGDVAGEHTVFLFGQNERIELTHRSQSADIFASGALEACRRLWRMDCGLYTLQSVMDSAGALAERSHR